MGQKKLKKKWWKKIYYAAEFCVCGLQLWKVLVISYKHVDVFQTGL